MKTKSPTLFYLHWNEAELKEKIKPLKKAGITVHSHWSQESTPKWGDELPEIFVISLDRLPSHGRQYAQWLWEAKKRQHIPLIFVGGQKEKVEDTRKKFPKALYCSEENLTGIIGDILKNR
ncbi:MAG: hypothetical protein ACOZCO_16035 [Bacteroidota bacterium]|jgi:hypothetical protein